MLIDVSYFTTGPRHILNASTASTPAQNSLSVNKAIMGYVAHYQLAFLCELLGDSLAMSLDEYLAEKDEAEEEGREPETNVDYERICSQIRQSFADYVFFYILRDAATQATDRGLVIWKNENEVVSPIGRQVAIWNEMVNRNIRFAAWASVQSGDAFDAIEVSDNMTTHINAFNL